MTATIYQFPVRASAAEVPSSEESFLDPSERRIRQLYAILVRAMDNPQTDLERRFAAEIALLKRGRGEA